MTTPPDPNRFYTPAGISRTYVASRSQRWETSSDSGWIYLPDTEVNPSVGGSTSPSYGAIFIATFSAEALSSASNNNNVLCLDIEFDGESGYPRDVDGNYRFASASASGEWASHTTIRHYRVEPRMNADTVPIKVKVRNGRNASTNNGRLGLQNWTLRVDRYNL
ncbi:hypothetical protein [Streptomyces sp. NPDC017529]|uniref:hypothetical protein n=1 Tax=Streptomyces sp. NPDC017529 TaxID=3365000 RepID=UPI0037AA95D7